MRKGHVLSAHLDGQKEIAERGKGRRGEHKEDHDRPMHGHQLQVILGRHHVAGRAIGGKEVQPRNGEVRPSQVNAHQPREHHAGEDSDQSQPVILLADHLVIETEDMLTNEAGRSSMGRYVCRHVVHWLTSNEMFGPAEPSAQITYCMAACCFSQLSKSSGDFTSRYAFML